MRRPERTKLAERKICGADWTIAGCGGWSKRKTLYGSDHWAGREDALLDPQRDAAKIRAFFIHPAWARQGIGSRILEACEIAASAAGFTSYEMGATLTGAKLFGVKGYVAVEKIEVPLKGGLSLPVIRMAKRALERDSHRWSGTIDEEKRRDAEKKAPDECPWEAQRHSMLCPYKRYARILFASETCC